MIFEFEFIGEDHHWDTQSLKIFITFRLYQKIQFLILIFMSEYFSSRYKIIFATDYVRANSMSTVKNEPRHLMWKSKFRYWIQNHLSW